MKKKTKMSTRLLSLILSIMMVVSMLPMTVFAQPVKTNLDTRETMEITDEDLKSNEYETYYYSEDIAYTYKGDLVSFINEEQIQAGEKTYNLKNKKTEVSVNTEEAGSVTVDLTNISVPVGQISGQWNVYFGGTVQMVYKTDIPGMEEVRSAGTTNAPKTLTLTNVPEGTYHLTGGTVYEKANQWSPGHDFGNGVVTEAYFGTLPNITITVGNPVTEEYIGVKTDAKIYDDFENDIWLQYQQKEMKVGETVNLRPWRVEQIVSDVIQNDVARPNFHFEIIKGDSISLDTTESNQKAIVTAKKPGTSIVKVTYDALEYKGETWGAISTVNTAYAVFTVGETGTATITTNEEFKNWRHYDTIYYKDGETVPYTFTVDTENAKSVKVTVNGMEIQGNGNQYTANLENRSNIIGIEVTDADGNVKSMYRVIDARFIEVNVANKTSPNEPLKTGDTANISFRGITMPVYKLATIYNPQFGRNATKVTYSNDKLGEFEGKCGQWDLATNNDFDVKFTEAGDFTFHSKDGIRCAWWGSPLGTDITANGSGEPNLNAPTLTDNFSTLPDFTVHVEEKTAVESITLSQTEMSLKLGETGQLSATVLPDSATHKEVTWSSSDKDVVSVSDGKLTALKAGTATITAEADGKKADCKVTVTAYSVEEVNEAIAAIPDVNDITLRDKKTIENARQLYDNLSTEDKEKVKDTARLTDAEAKIQELISIPFIFSLNDTPLKITQEEANSYRGHYYKVEVPAGTKTVQLERYKNIKVQDQSYKTLIPEETSTVDIENIKYSKGNYIILNYDMYWYDYIYFVEADESVPVSEITLDKTELTLNEGQSDTLTATVLPDNATNKEITWNSSDESIATVDTNGTVIAVKAGETTITAKADGKTAECKVIVQAEGVSEDQYVTVSIERFTLGQGFYMEPVKVKLEQGQTAMDVIRNLVGENLVTNEAGTYISGIKGADLGVDSVEIPAYISEKLEGPTTEAAREMGNDDDVLGEFDYSNSSGWYYFVNNEAPNVGLADWPLNDGDVLRLQFTVLYGEDLTGTFFGEDKPVIEISNKDSAMVLLAEFNSRDDKDELLQVPAVANAYNDLKTIVQNAIAPQADVDADVVTLENALEVANAKAELSTLIEQAKAKDEADYTKDSFEAFKNALDAAERVVADDNADLTAVSDAKTALTEAMQSLVEKPQVSKDALQTAIEEADKKVKEDYTAESFETFERVLKEAKEIYANEDATQEEVDNQTALLNAAMANLVVKPEEPEKPADKSKLESALEKAEALTKADYTEETWNVFADVLKKAQSVDKNEKATQEEVDEAVNELESAIDQLEKVNGGDEKPSVEELKALVEKAEKLDENGYVASTWGNFAQTLESAKAVLNSEDATQEEIDAAKVNLQKAIDALVVKIGWQEINGQKYYYGEDGTKKTGWQEIDGKKYYFGDENDGAMKTYWQQIDGKWYFLGNDGVMRTYWQKIWGKWYFLGSANDGAMKTGWQKIWGKWYYLGSANDGVMKTGWQKVYGKWYYLGGAEDGVMKSYWQQINGKWYFFGSADDGAMKTGWQKIWGKWYYFGSVNDGVMKTGWQKINGKWYYFGGEQDGSMKSNTWVGDYYVDNSGVWSKTKAKKSK